MKENDLPGLQRRRVAANIARKVSKRKIFALLGLIIIQRRYISYGKSQTQHTLLR